MTETYIVSLSDGESEFVEVTGWEYITETSVEILKFYNKTNTELEVPISNLSYFKRQQ